ncbi:ABC transporter permease [Cytobacillus firmus]|uniref:ABC transporter permease n=1 Tax=Cytobacillus firmus TaxID=1399 RepID=UPI001C8D1CB1|nr:ABC transporter permease [Cytobacillus firmus]MBX9975167.1 ABC transporter permease [Cytobacillus firmus]
MSSFLVKRLLALIPVLLTVSAVVFMIIHFIPGDPAAAMLGSQANEEQLAQLREKMGLNEPLFIQFTLWLFNLLQGDLGSSLVSDQTVLSLIANRLPVTLNLIIYSMTISILIAIPLGVISAVKHNTGLDYASMIIALIGISIPNFWAALLLIMIFALNLGMFPATGYVAVSESSILNIKHLTLPAFSLGFIQAGIITRMTRTSMLDVLRQDYIRTVKAKGASPFTLVFRHALKNAMIPIITIIGINFGLLLGGTVVVESIFSINGIGQLMIQSVLNRDYPVIQGIILVIAAIYVFITLFVDILYTYFDPKIKYSKG